MHEAQEGLESNPLVADMNFQTWVACLPRWILKTRTQFARALALSFAVVRRSAESTSMAFPLPLASLDCFGSSGPKLPRRRFWTLCKDRLVNIWILILDFMFLGRWPTATELRRCPNPLQLSIFQRLRTFAAMCGEAQARFNLCPGRSGPELGAELFQLERFSEVCSDLHVDYLDSRCVGFQKNPNLLPQELFPELVPYRALDPSRLRLVGEGKWPLCDFLDGVLWLPFQEPKFLLHGFPVEPGDQPCLQAERRSDCLDLAKLWDVRGLLHLSPAPIQPGLLCRVFNAFKNKDCDRQIGDRRIVNQAEFHVDGPSKNLPQGQQLTMLRLPRFTHMLRGSVTDRRDFYHQAKVSEERAVSNALPFAYRTEVFAGTRALVELGIRYEPKKKGTRETAGDGLRDIGKTPTARRSSPALPERVYPCFQSLFQGDHLGVEFALQSHAVLLEGCGLLDSSTRILGHHGFPPGPHWDALVIDDYFALSCEPLSCHETRTFAMSALSCARSIYEKEGLLGSDEKDVVAQSTVKAAGAEIRSSPKNVRSGVVPVGAPFGKRLALAVLSLRASRLPGISPRLSSRLAGCWVSVLQYRKCWSSLVDSLFGLVARGEESGDNNIRCLPRKVAQELSTMAAAAPLMFTNIAVDYLDRIFATDASVQKGAVVSAAIDPALTEKIWLGSDKKGAYTHLSNGFHALLRQIGEVDDDCDVPGPTETYVSPEKPLLLYFDFVEICGGAGKVSEAMVRKGWTVAPVLDLSDSRHYDLGSVRFLEWIIHMLEEDRFRSFLVEPPCTTFSPAAHPAVRSYKEPLGFDRKNPKTLLGNVLAFRSLVLLRVAKRFRRPCGLEQSRLSKMAWLAAWKSLLLLGFKEAVIASCMFGSPHRKEFRLLCYMLDVDFLDVRCCGGHEHVQIQGQLTKPSAVYVDGLADHLANAFHNALVGLDAERDLQPEVEGFESPVINDLALSSRWSVVRAWFWKRKGHINVLELGSAVSSLQTLCQERSSVRFSSLVDSAVCRGALTKGRSASRALQPGLKRAGALCIAADLYPCWNFCPTRLNTADDPTRSVSLRTPMDFSLCDLLSEAGQRLLVPGFLRRHAANWVRLTLCLVLLDLGAGVPCDGFSPDATASPRDQRKASSISPLGLFGRPWISVFPWCHVFWSLLFLGGFLAWIFVFQVSWFQRSPPQKVWHPSKVSLGLFIAMVLCCCDGVFGMPLAAQSPAERLRAQMRSDALLFSTRAVKPKTREQREIYLERFRSWLWNERGLSFKFLIEQKPADPERIASLLVEYGRELFHAGKAYGIFSETINAVAVQRPLIRKQLTQAWDLAFAWLADEPHVHHPALPLSVMCGLVTVALTWGWPYEAAIIMLTWAGLLRIGEVLSAFRKDLILPLDAAPGTSFMLLVIRAPKTRGRSAKHQAARVDQTDIIRYLTAMYGKSPKDTKLWPYSASTLRKRFQKLLTALYLPTTKTTNCRPFDLGSLRPGGATWLLHQVEDAALVQRRGRWLSARVMEIYLQESFVSTFIRGLDPKTRTRIELCSGAFATTLERAISFLDSGIPPGAWFSLYKMTARDPEKIFESMG